MPARPIRARAQRLIELPDEAKLFVVQALACFDTPAEVAKAVNDAFGLPMSRQAAERYDPTKPAGAALSAGHRAIFDATRATFLTETAAIGVSHRAVRLRRLQCMVDKAEGMGNIAIAAKLLEQAAREMGHLHQRARRVGRRAGRRYRAQHRDPLVKPGEARRPAEADPA